jgi:hypothetical protein
LLKNDRWEDHLIDKTIFEFTRKVQVKKGIPYLYLIKHLRHAEGFFEGKEVNCKLQVGKKVKLVIELE